MPRKIQLAIQGGGAKIVQLLAAAEAVQELESAGRLRVTRIAGTSAGAIVGALYAAGVNLGGLRQTLRNGLGKKLISSFDKPGYTRLTWSLLRGTSFWNEDVLKAELDDIFGKDMTLEKLTQKRGIELHVVYSAMLEGRDSVARPTDFLSNALMHSAGIPFCFRTWKGANANLIDGGICDNFPWEKLSKDIGEFGPILGIAFNQTRPTTPTDVLKFSSGLLDLAIDNSMAYAKQRLGPDAIFSMQPRFGTFDFSDAMDKGLQESYDLDKSNATKFFTDFVTGKNTQRIRGASWDGNLAFLKKLGKVYEIQHAPSKFRYEHCAVQITAYSLRDDGPTTDSIHYSARFSTGQDPIYCHAISVTDTNDATDLDESGFSLFGPQEQSLEGICLPILDSISETRQLLICFSPVIPANSGPYDLQIKDAVDRALRDFQDRGKDEVVFTPQRAVGAIRRIDLVLHHPNSIGAQFVAKENGPGRPMTAFELRNYPAPPGFKAIGWTGENLDSKQPFGADIIRFSV